MPSIRFYYSLVILHIDASGNQKHTSISQRHKHKSLVSGNHHPPEDLSGCDEALAPFGSGLPPGNQCSFYLLVHTPHIDLCSPGHPACRQ